LKEKLSNEPRNQEETIKMNEPIISKLDKLKSQQEKLKARIQLMEARAKESERKKDTRRKILVGSYFLDKAKEKNQLDEIKERMNTFLTRNSDRILFGLPLLEEEKK
jgi:hypothetical protein